MRRARWCAEYPRDPCNIAVILVGGRLWVAYAVPVIIAASALWVILSARGNPPPNRQQSAARA